ncbi:phosphoribosylaminoimidazolesuccinocarboxamide synthase [Pseudoclavibacter soli]|uniref:phosphoribosylaminoimidazolesuccinocarboxamide synthase n=1 Tax=Pseudoclavibacter soli TaxID=452623 RepID=UPI0003FCC87E|nr:phosphoribosylaminoimidazolesuccinocarboxamide synthase [Pseudoclavibacter soli]
MSPVNTPIELPGWKHVYSGKVRELYIPLSSESLEAADQLLLVASDRVSAFDHLLEPPIPDKGELLNRLALWWFDRIDFPNHILSTDVPDAVAGRAIIAKRLDMYPIEAVVRGYLAGSAWEEYQQTGRVTDIELPAGLSFGDRLPEPIYTPAFKAPAGQHDENITFDQSVELVGADAAAAIRDASLSIYAQGAAVAEAHGLILADTKFEFGNDLGHLVLADEVLTSDSSRYWSQQAWAEGRRKESFDKQIVRNWLLDNWDRTGTPPELPAEIVSQTAARYRELFELLTQG